MSAFTIIVIIGFLLIIGGIPMMGTPLLTFMSGGVAIILLFFIAGCFGVVRGIREERYDKNFIFSIVSLILGIAGCLIPGAAAMSNYVILYLAAIWFIVRGILSIVDAFAIRKQGGGFLAFILGIVLGVLELLLGVYSVAHPASLALTLGVLIGLYYIETGFNVIAVGSATCRGSNNMTLIFTIMGIVTIIGGIVMLATPLITFLGVGYCIILLFFMFGVLGIVRAISEKRFDKDFFFAILSLILGIIGCLNPGIANMSSSVLLYMAAIWFIIRGVMSIFTALKLHKEGAGLGVTVIGVLLGVLELVLGIYSIAHPAVLAISFGLLIGFYYIESGVNMIFVGSEFSRLVAERVRHSEQQARQ